MNKLVIPPSANWYETSILACAPDNTLIYGARNDIVVIYDVPNDQPADIRIIPRAHSQKIVSTSINKNWGNPHKLLVTVAEDNIIKLWDIETRKKKLGHNGHAGHGKIIGATFAGDDRVISVSEGGIIVVWNVTLNQINTLKDIFGLKVTITCISTCPHATWLTAFGLKNGLVVVTDLRKQGKVLYKLRGHDKSVLSLSWCPAPVNIFPIDPQNSVGAKSNPDHLTENSSSVDKSETCNDSLSLNIQNDNRNVTENTNDMNHKPTISDVITENKQTKKTNKIWTDLKFNDDEDPEVLTESRETTTAELDNSINDFLKECEDLKEKIRKDPAVTDESNNRVEDNIEGDRVIVKAKRKRRKSLKGKKHNLKISNEQTPEIGKSDEGHGNSSNADTSVNIVVEDFVIYSDNNDNKVLDAGIEVETNVLSQDELTSKLEEQDILLHNEKTRLYFSETNTESCINTAVKETSIDSTNVLKDSEEVKQEYIASPVTSADKDAIELSPVKDAIKENSLEEKYSLDDLGKIEVPEIAGEDTKIGSNEQTVKEGVEEIGCEGEKQVQVKEIIKEEPRREFLLASSGKDGNIYIWRAGTDGRMQTFLSIPKPIYHRSHRSNFDKLWIVVCWISPTVLLSSSKAAELIKWTLPKPKDKNKQYSIIHNDHNSILFSIAAPVVLLNDYNWLDQRKLNVWTFGHDRVLLNTSLSSERKNLAYYPTLGNAECFASSPLDPNRQSSTYARGSGYLDKYSPGKIIDFLRRLDLLGEI
ncbi:hypothetical protein NQ315_013849 [Exocentrus adspersus]|uniref:Uncharacterized protein n=1 Tax=Exocentrus adspersus TaxID=1586481 RepID=A0AAV8VGV6_9CUCU|nr:hypothetical protein NQ315_013849 [Exocentrus adspersus]